VQCLAATGDYLRALSKQDRSAAVGVAGRAADARTSVADVIEQMLVPAQVEVGIRAQHDDWSIADEHAATAITEVVLGVLAMRQPPPVPRPAPICVTTPPGEWHGLAARMVAEGLRARGWDAIYLGSDLPDDHLGRFLQRVQPAALLLSCTTAAVLPQLARSLDVAMNAGLPTIVGGSACGTDEHRALAVGANAWAKDAASAHVLLSRWVDEGVAPPPARRAGIPADYLEVISRRSLLVDLLADRSARMSASAPAAGRHQAMMMRQVGAQLVDVLAASMFVDDPGLFDGHVTWLADMLDARGIPPDTTSSLLEVLQPALIDIPSAERFTAIGRGPRSA
jgi:MerR family transcriptional regulator, light-induced transcriptional regulator